VITQTPVANCPSASRNSRSVKLIAALLRASLTGYAGSK
jgi:hypothetical protein